LLLAVSGCRTPSPPETSYSIIDWADVIRLDGRDYVSVFDSALADPAGVGTEAGRITHRLEGNVHDPGYNLRNGDAAFWDKGTVVYEVKGFADRSLLAVPDPSIPGGYRLYGERGRISAGSRNFDRMPRDQAVAIDRYRYASDGKAERIGSIEGGSVRNVLALLDRGSAGSYKPADAAGTPTRYSFVFQTGDPIGYRIDIYHDGVRYYWYRNDTQALPDEIGTYMAS
jgi:hypothetical protein